MSITVVGSIAYDTVKTPFGERERMLGGAAVHFALAASFFEDVCVVGPVGDDFGEAQLEVMRSTGPRLLWNATAELHGAPQWQRLRDLAQAALDALGLPSAGHDVLAGVQPAKMIQALRELLGWLAQPAAEQELYLDQPFAPPVQDLPLTLDDCVAAFVPRLTSAGSVSPAAARAVTAVRDFIRSPATQADPARCDQATLATSPTWATLRDLARAALDTLG